MSLLHTLVAMSSYTVLPMSSIINILFKIIFNENNLVPHSFLNKLDTTPN